MRILFTSDWQSDFENLDLCRKTMSEILTLKSRFSIDILVHAGDFKHAYSPVDVRVTNFAVNSIDKLRQAGLRVIICLGNHDRVGMYVDKQNWFPVLRKAGAEAYDDPVNLVLGDGYSLGILPFRTSPTLLRREASDLARGLGHAKGILVFHSDVKTAQYNVLTKSEAGISIADLHHSRYKFCIGGHIHWQHKVRDNVWYVGSPFATDWGEANQRKGYLLVDTKTEKLTRVRSEIPGWYDPSWPGFEEARPDSWHGARIRIKVPCANAKHIGTALQEAKEKAEKKYVGAVIVCIPEIAESEFKKGEILSEYSDKKKLAIYLRKSLPEDLQSRKGKVLEYLTEQLSQAGGLIREGGELHFSKYTAENFLSFKKLESKIEPGLCVVAGENRDWNRSNGAGKSSYLQPLAVALFGTTFKGQKHDRWMRRGTKKGEKSYVAVWLTDAQGRRVLIKRRRQPSKLRLFINDESIESGNRPEATQKMIEQVTGYTWETLSNAIYVDQGRAHLMLTGTEAERKNFLNRLQNLERFERAGKLVKGQKTALESALDTVEGRLGRLVSEVQTLSRTIIQAKEVLQLGANPELDCKVAKDAWEVAQKALAVWEEKAAKKREVLEQKIELKRKEYRAWELKKGVVSNTIHIMQDDVDTFKNDNPHNGVCPVCRQKISAEHARMERVKANKAIALVKEEYEKLKSEKPEDSLDLEDELSRWERNRELEAALEVAKEKKQEANIHLAQYTKQKVLISTWKKEKERLLEKIEVKKKIIKKYENWMKVFIYAEQVFARNGLPAFLNAQLCPQLNKEATYYSELFSQKEIQIRFTVDEEGSMDVQVLNAHGGESVQDQSEGEMKMASLITSFAVRASAPKTNLLILDEPGDGLDPVSARQFARGLKEVVKKFGSIFCVTHNTNILSELSDSRLLTIVKENSISRMEEQNG